jgi:hypothetical protein
MDGLLDLPVDILYLICKRIDFFSFPFAKLTCKIIYDLLARQKPYMRKHIPEQVFTSSLSRLQYVISNKMFDKVGNFGDLFRSAIEYGDLDVVKHLHKLGMGKLPNSISVAAQYGHIKIIVFLEENGYLWQQQMVDVGDPDFGKVKYDNRIYWEDPTIAAARAGHLECFEYLVNKGHRVRNDQVYYEAIKHGHMNIVKFMLDNNYICYIHIINDITRSIHKNYQLEAIRLFLDKGYEIEYKIYHGAIINNNLDIVKGLHEMGIPWNHVNLHLARTHLARYEIADYMEDNGCMSSDLGPHEIFEVYTLAIGQHARGLVGPIGFTCSQGPTGAIGV